MDHKIGFATAGASSLTAWMAGVPVWTAVCAFAGASMILSFLRLLEGPWRTIFMVGMCTFLGILASPIIPKIIPSLSGFEPAIAFFLSAGAQIFIPLMVEYKKDVFLWVISYMPHKRESERERD